MKKITISQYNKAVKIIDLYRKQQEAAQKAQKGNFGFLYWLDTDDKDHFRWVKAKNVDSACRKFMRIAPQSLHSIDYEVNFEDTFIDISDNSYVKEFI